ncbi:MAG: DEAD/DEAH box helicase [Syntrophobacterales bacterium]|jgi:superfamily II RNA helicase|nr:DEAD/DEAH box helicase [Syntrophobacterales bacterium]
MKSDSKNRRHRHHHGHPRQEHHHGDSDGQEKYPQYEPRHRLKPEIDTRLQDVFKKIGKPSRADFVPDPFQLEALETIKHSDCLVTAPTGSGKTWIAEQAIAAVLKQGGRCWYASPLKALTNSKWVEFSACFDDANVGILTGDTKENTNAPVIVGTTEILRNQLYDMMHRGENFPCDLVVIDEAHYLGDADRGVVWEEVMIYLPSRIHLLLLSATIGNGDELSGWLSRLRGKPCAVIKEKKRSVPLYPLFLHPSGRLIPNLANKKLSSGLIDFIERSERDRRLRYTIPRIADIMAVMDRFNLTPAIFFLKSRVECDAALGHCHPVSSDIEDENFTQTLNELLERFPYLARHRHLTSLKQCRVASHHGGQLPAWKFLVETMMNRGHLRAIFATSTVAAGVNYPARTIVLFNSDRYNGHEFRPMNSIDFHQMTGRAGRRGQDKIGFMLAIPGRFMDVHHLRKLMYKKPEAIESQLKSDFSMVLNLLLSQSLDDIQMIFGRSLASYQDGQENRDKQYRWNNFMRHLAFLKKEDFVDEGDRLTENGIWASKLRLDQPLLIAECLRKGVFPRYDAKLLAALIAPFVYDGDQEIKITRKITPRKLAQGFNRVKRSLADLLQRMDGENFPVSPMFLWPAWAIYAWARETPWQNITEQIHIADGDLAMLITRTSDNLRQISSLKESHPEVADLAYEAMTLILREPVVFS